MNVSTEVFVSQVIGQGSADLELSERDLARIVEQALDPIQFGERVLAIVPIKLATTTPIFSSHSQPKSSRAKSAQFDALIAQGTTRR